MYKKLAFIYFFPLKLNFLYIFPGLLMVLRENRNERSRLVAKRYANWSVESLTEINIQVLFVLVKLHTHDEIFSLQIH